MVALLPHGKQAIVVILLPMEFEQVKSFFFHDSTENQISDQHVLERPGFQIAVDQVSSAQPPMFPKQLGVLVAIDEFSLMVTAGYIPDSDKCHIHEVGNVVRNAARIRNRHIYHMPSRCPALVSGVRPEPDELMFPGLQILALRHVTGGIKAIDIGPHVFINKNSLIDSYLCSIQEFYVRPDTDTYDQQIRLFGSSAILKVNSYAGAAFLDSVDGSTQP